MNPPPKRSPTIQKKKKKNKGNEFEVSYLRKTNKKNKHEKQQII